MPTFTAGHRPVPRIIRAGIWAATDAAADPNREPREASVVGGDATRGWLRIDVTFDAALPDDCKLPLTLAVAADRGLPSDRAALDQSARVFDGLSVVEGRADILPHLARAMDFRGNGTASASWRVPIRATERERAASYALKLVVARDYAGGLPFTVNVQPLPAFTLVAPSGPTQHDAPTVFAAELPVALLPGSAGIPLRFRLSSTTLGRWQRSAAVSPTDPAEILAGWDSRFAQPRAEVVFIPGDVAQTMQGTLSVTWAGSTKTVPFSVNPATVCDPAFTVAAVPGGLRLTMANRNRGACPAHLATPLMPARATLQLSPASSRVTSPAVAALRPVTPGAARTTGAKLPTASAAAAMLGAQRTDGGALFTINRLALIQLSIGARFDFDVSPEGQSTAATRQRVSITLDADDLATITGRKQP